MRPLRAMCDNLSDIGFLQRVGLCTRYPPPGVRGDCCAEHPAILEQDWLANTWGTLTLRQLGREMVTNSWHLYGYPGQFAALQSEELAPRVLQRMQRLWHIWTGPVAEKQSAFWNAAKKRSVFNDMYVLKVFKVAESVGWERRPALLEAIASGFRVPGGSAIAEHAFQHLEHVTSRSHCNKKAAVRRQYVSCITSTVQA